MPPFLAQSLHMGAIRAIPTDPRPETLSVIKTAIYPKIGKKCKVCMWPSATLCWDKQMKYKTRLRKYSPKNTVFWGGCVVEMFKISSPSISPISEGICFFGQVWQTGRDYLSICCTSLDGYFPLEFFSSAWLYVYIWRSTELYIPMYEINSKQNPNNMLYIKIKKKGPCLLC